MVGQHAGVVRALDPVMRELCRREHEVVFLQGRRDDDERLAEIADVTVIAVRRELQSHGKTRSAKRHAYSPASGGRRASEASPIAAGSR